MLGMLLMSTLVNTVQSQGQHAHNAVWGSFIQLEFVPEAHLTSL